MVQLFNTVDVPDFFLSRTHTTHTHNAPTHTHEAYNTHDHTQTHNTISHPWCVGLLRRIQEGPITEETKVRDQPAGGRWYARASLPSYIVADLTMCMLYRGANGVDIRRETRYASQREGQGRTRHPRSEISNRVH